MALIEFPPAVHDGVAYVINKYGNAKAVRLGDRKVLWEVKVRPSDKGKPNFVTAPVYHRGLLYGAFLDGQLAAGHTQNRQESLGARPRRPPRIVPPGGRRHALHRHRQDRPGRAAGKVPPFGRGGFFSSPAIGFGKVYAARDDGTVFAFDEKTGKVEWSFDSGDYVYGSPAVAQVPGTKPTVCIGAENGRFYALDATSGKVAWRRDVGGPIPGTAVVIGRTVYTSSFKTGTTVGYDALTQRKTFELKQAGYTPVVSDGRRVYLIGYYVLVGLEPAKR